MESLGEWNPLLKQSDLHQRNMVAIIGYHACGTENFSGILVGVIFHPNVTTATVHC